MCGPGRSLLQDHRWKVSGDRGWGGRPQCDFGGKKMRKL